MSNLLKDLDNLTLLLGDFYPKTTFLCTFYVAKGPFPLYQIYIKIFDHGYEPLSRLNNVQTRHSKQGGFCVFHTETCKAWPYYDTFIEKWRVYYDFVNVS